MTGKEKCKRLKKYREALAKANGIEFQSKECDFEGECPGFCPACDEEILFLEKELKEKARRGEHIKFKGLIRASFKNGDKVYDCNLSTYSVMMGKIVSNVPNDEPKKELSDEELEKAILKLINVSPREEDVTTDDDDTLMGDIVPPYDNDGDNDW